MTVQPLEEQTYLTDQPEQVAKILSFLDAHEATHGAKPEARYLLVGAEEHDTVEVPEAVHRALRQVVEALKAGKAVTVAPHSKMLTTQQAADILGVSRPTVVKLIDAKVLPAVTPGVRRRLVKLSDVLEYRNLRREQQYKALMETSVDYHESEEDASERAERMRRARAEVRKERARRKASI